MRPCTFCEIVAGRAPASLVYRDDLVCAFLDIQPVNPGHLLVIPIEHASDLSALDPEIGAHLFRVGQRLVAALKSSSLRCEGANLLLADGEAAGQEVFHVHLHIIPRYAADGFGFRFAPDYPHRPTRDSLDRDAESIRAVLRDPGDASA